MTDEELTLKAQNGDETAVNELLKNTNHLSTNFREVIF